jgi:hypothetical protein
VEGYPPLKLLVNRLGNQAMRLLFGRSENDLSNALKAYHADVLRAAGPFESDHFEIFVELPLKALAVGARVATVPVEWRGRRAGASKLKLVTQVPRYAAVILRLWLARRAFAQRGLRQALRTAGAEDEGSGVRARGQCARGLRVERAGAQPGPGVRRPTSEVRRRGWGVGDSPSVVGAGRSPSATEP